MKEYESCANNEQVIFNNMLRSARNPIECAFGRLKARWSILTRKMDLKIEAIPIVVYACFVLHNFCEKKNSYIDEDLVHHQMNIIKTRVSHAESTVRCAYCRTTYPYFPCLQEYTRKLNCTNCCHEKVHTKCATDLTNPSL